MQASNPVAVNRVLTTFRDKLHNWLAQTSGYECQEVEGDCMLAFADAVQAIIFCLLVCSSTPVACTVTLGLGLSCHS